MKKSTKKLTKEIFIKRAIKIHGNKYDYSKVEYKNICTKICIICSIHGEFWQEANSHLSGRNCFKCNGSEKHTKEIFSNKAIKIHGNKYDYSKVEYKGNKIKVEIICPVHGSFWQRPDNHLQGNTCGKCRMSNGEEKIKWFLEENNIKFEYQKLFDDCKNIRKLPFDFYLSESNTTIEYDGRQHFIPIEPWGGDEGLKKIKNHDKIRNDFIIKNNINSIRIPYWEFKNIDKILEKTIL